MISMDESKKSDLHKKFPEGFLWGSSTASYQVEGGIDHVDWAQAAKEGKVPVCGRAIDHYHRYEEDFDLAQSLGHTAHRFSIEWARIEPEEGKFDESEIEHYRKVLRALKQRGMEPFVTLWHFTLPVWFSNKGGFERSDAEMIFKRYCIFVIERLGNEATFWITMNEPLVWSSNGYAKGTWPPFHKSIISFFLINRKLAEIHKEVYGALKQLNPTLQIGIAKHNIYFTSNSMPWNIVASKVSHWYWNTTFLNAIRGAQDFVGLNHYFYKRFGGNGNLPKSDMGWDIFPDAIYHCLIDLKKYAVPIYITENGIADRTDSKRAEFIKGYLSAVLRAIQDGVQVKGYLYWSLLDNYEWAFGFTERFGLIEVHPETLTRLVRPSAYVYKEIIDKNSIL